MKAILKIAVIVLCSFPAHAQGGATLPSPRQEMLPEGMIGSNQEMLRDGTAGAPRQEMLPEGMAGSNQEMLRDGTAESPREERMLREWVFCREGGEQRRVRIPHDWAIAGPFDENNDLWYGALGWKRPGISGSLPWTGKGSYRTTFRVPEGKNVTLLFDGAMGHPTVRVNGREVGSWPNGYSAVPLDITDAVVPCEENTVEVSLDNPPRSSRWYPGAGLYRNVHLITADPVHIPVWGTWVTTPEVTREKALVRLEITVEGGRGAVCRTDIIAPDGRIVASAQTGGETTLKGERESETSGEAALGRERGTETGDCGEATLEGERGRETSGDADGGSAGNDADGGSADNNGGDNSDAGGGAVKFVQEIEVGEPRLWGPESPALYSAVTTVWCDGRLADRYVTPFGIRKAEFIEGKGFFLNGERVRFKGVCLHHDQGPLGAAVNVAALRHQLEMMKDMGCNAIRTSHNQPAPELVRLCDEMGFMMMLESFDEWNSAKCANGYHVHFREWAEKDLAGMVRCFRNSPSVVMWSTGNEICRTDITSEGLAEAQFLTDICHREDPTRPVTVGMHKAGRWASAKWRGAFDIIGLNYNLKRFLKVKEDIGDRLLLWTESGSTVSSRGVYHLPAEKRNDMRRSPDRQCSSFDLEACNWSNIPDDDFAVQEDYPWDLGQFVWTGFDYLGEPTPYDHCSWPNHSSMFGIVDLASIPKDRYWLYRSVWNTEAHTLHLLPHWNWSVGQEIPVYVYTDAPAAELFLNGRSLGVRTKAGGAGADGVAGARAAKTAGAAGAAGAVAKTAGAAGEAGAVAKTTGARSERNEERFRLRWDVAYEPGELMAVAISAAGEPMDTVFMRTAGEPAGLRAEYDGRRLKADGEDLAYVTVSVVDADGNVCPTSDATVSFEVTGAGSFLACANGDPTCTDPFQPPAATEPGCPGGKTSGCPGGEKTGHPGMHAFSGKLTAIVQSRAANAGQNACAPGQSPGANGQSPGVNGQSPCVNGQSPCVNGQSPGVNGQSPGTSEKSPCAPGQPIVLRAFSPGLAPAECIIGTVQP